MTYDSEKGEEKVKEVPLSTFTLCTPVRARSSLYLAAPDTRMEDDVVTRRRIMLLVLLVSLVGRSSSSAGVRFECFDDLCVSRLQYCSDSQQRCQYCRKEHCLDPAFTPTQCQPLCPELLSTSPDEATPSTYRTSSTSGLPERQHGVEISTESLMTATVVLFILVIVLLIVILVLAVCLCNYAIPVYKNLLRQRHPLMEANMLEENKTLLKETRQKKKPGETKGFCKEKWQSAQPSAAALPCLTSPPWCTLRPCPCEGRRTDVQLMT